MEVHLELTVDCVESLYDAIKASVGGLEDPLQKLREVSHKEEEADYTRRMILNELSASELMPDDKAALMDLVRRIDWIADWAREAGRLMSIIRIEGLDEELKSMVLRMVERIKECTYNVRSTVALLLSDVEKSLESADRVERLEEEVDDIYEECRKTFIKTGSCGDATLGEMIMIAQFLDALENIADWCENTVDQVRVIAVRVSRPEGLKSTKR
jgi:predicted phosphate transport protein (TIGR00153 family)